jgi:plasmid stabilization system protein ParE
MDLKVFWTKRAKNTYSKILDYIISEFGNSAGRKYFERVEHTIKLIVSFPELGIKQNKDNKLYAIIIYRRTTIFYTFDKTEIKIINIVDNRWNK